MRGESFVIRAMTQSDAYAVAAWHQSGIYSFYDWEQDPDDLAELLDPEEWGRRYFAVDQEGELVEFFGAESYTLAVAAFNRRATMVYERAGFAETERYQHRTNGGVHEFIRMTRVTGASPDCCRNA